MIKKDSETLKITKFFQIIKPKYVYFQLKPNNSIKNQNTDRIAKAISSLYSQLTRRIYKFEKKFFMQSQTKVSYYIYIEQKSVKFYFIIPEIYKTFMKEKIQNSWKGITIQEVKDVPLFSKKAEKYYMTYTKEDGLSLEVDKRSNKLLNSILNVLPIMKEDDKLGIFYNFVPCNQYTWKSTYERTIEKFKKGMPLDREKKNMFYLFKIAIIFLVYILEIIEDAIFNLTKTKQETKKLSDIMFDKLNKKELSPSTIKKGHLSVLNTQILILSQEKNKDYGNNNAKALTTTFKVISEDNELKPKKINKAKFTPTKLYLNKVDVIKTSTDECQNFIQLPGRELLEEYNYIEKIETQQIQVPKELQTGTMCIGEVEYRGKKQKAFLSTDKEYKYLTLVIIAPTRAGKTTLIANLAHDALKSDECMILFDFVGNCELSEGIKKTFSPNKILEINCADINNLQGLGYNEIKYNNSPFEQYKNAKKKTTQLKTLVNSINANDKNLSPKMDRYLTSASLITFISDGSVNDVFKVLQDYKSRIKYLNNISQNQHKYLDEYINYLEEINNRDKKGNIIGTKFNLIAGIIDRLNVLQDNPFLELMLKKDCKNNIDLVKEIDKNQLITIKMPEDMFATDNERDVYTTYWITKLWLSLQIRKSRYKNRHKMKKVNLVIDELYQVKNTERFLTSKLSRLAKFNLKPIISCHYLNQIDIIREELRSANTSYMLISGCDKKNYTELKEELYPFTAEDLSNLKRFYSLNCIKYKGGYAKFITKLPNNIIIE